MALLVLVLVVSPWLFRKRIENKARVEHSEQRMRANVRIFKERLRDLQAELSASQITQTQFGALKNELEDSLLSDTSGDAHEKSLLPAGKNVGFLLAIIALASVFATHMLYQSWGAYDLVVQQENSRFSQQEISNAQAMAEAGDTRGLLTQLREKLLISPDNVDGWSLLARSAMNTEHYDLAAEAYENLTRLEPSIEGKAALYGLVAQAHYFNGKTIDSPEVSIAMRQATDLVPEEANVLGLLAIDYYQKDEFELAIEKWTRILTLYPDHLSRSSIQMGIDRARMMLGESSTSVAKADPATAIEQSPNSSQNSETPKVTVQIQIDQDVLDSLSGAEMLVVFAKAVDGPPMPLAVARYPVRQAPSEIVLNDTMAMSPQLTISSFEQVDVVARITKGTVMREAGDFEVIHNSAAVSSSGEPLELHLTLNDKI